MKKETQIKLRKLIERVIREETTSLNLDMIKKDFIKSVFSKFNSSFANEVQLKLSGNEIYLEVPIQNITNTELEMIDNFFSKYDLVRLGKPDHESSPFGNRTNYSTIDFRQKGK